VELPNPGLRKFCHDILTVGKCDINCDSGRSGVYSTSGSDRPMADVQGMYGMAL